MVLQLWSRRASSPSSKRWREAESIFRSVCQGVTSQNPVPPLVNRPQATHRFGFEPLRAHPGKRSGNAEGWFRSRKGSRCLLWARAEVLIRHHERSKKFLVSVWCLLLESTRETKENQRDSREIS